jgi:glyoxylase I family protein|tara:strand:+ start:1987 stop:2529 length:543 start_codon:yes stop_codon:yes gene_type:complete
MIVKKIHHVAYRCHDAKETVQFYQKLLDMELLLVFAENKVPSTKATDPYMHVFLDAGMGNVLAFFELPNSPKMGRDSNTPEWVQHIAFEVNDINSLLDAKAKVEAAEIEVLGPIDHGLFKSIYFFDPNGHRLELVANTPISTEDMAKVQKLAFPMLEEWDRTKVPPKQTAWLHEKELGND